MQVKFWGTRGSLPQATSHHDMLLLFDQLIQDARHKGHQTIDSFSSALKNGELGHPISFGGNTTCTEILHGNKNFFVDMGSGLREAGSFYMPKGQKEFHIFLTHMHWDHVMGLPFFIPVHVPGYSIKIYHVHRNAPEYVKINFNGVSFPLTWDQLGGKIEFCQLKVYEPVTFDDLTVTPFVLDHPGGSFGYRFDTPTASCAVGVDGEFKRTTPRDLGKDLSFYKNLNLLVFDAQYEMAELASRFDWGHCSPNIGVDLALREGVRNLAFTHHDPWATPSKLHRMFKSASEYAALQIPLFQEQWNSLGQPAGPQLTMAWDGLVIDLDK